ncbi:MAG: dihydropteridine reductase [Bulleidia sp.]|nr:dihydropteridine reductase [Bulleidia sp.]
MNTDKIYAEQMANEYAPKDTTKVVALRKLDCKAKLPAQIAAYSIGIVSALVLGLGMCSSMGVVIGTGTAFMSVLGIVLGVIGIVGVSVNYPLYKKLLAAGKQKYAYEIMELAKEINNQE